MRVQAWREMTAQKKVLIILNITQLILSGVRVYRTYRIYQKEHGGWNE